MPLRHNGIEKVIYEPEALPATGIGLNEKAGYG
jgi:hypothetical protein